MKDLDETAPPHYYSIADFAPDLFSLSHTAIIFADPRSRYRITCKSQTI